MNILNFFRKNKKLNLPDQKSQKDKPKDNFSLFGKDFEFLIRGDINLSNDNYERVMTPNSISCKKILKEDGPFYQVGEDEFSYSWEMPGIQMTFNAEITYEKAKMIAEEVMENLKAEGQDAELLELKSDEVYKFD